jgi:Domain of unknown function (DUF4291)
MFRNGCGTKANQEVTLAITLRRSFFDELIALAVPSSFDASEFFTREAWELAVKGSDVRLQRDPDHDPQGTKQDRRAKPYSTSTTSLISSRSNAKCSRATRRNCSRPWSIRIPNEREAAEDRDVRAR